MRSLSPDEAELWAKVTASIRPLSRAPQSGPDPAQADISQAISAPVAPAKVRGRVPPAREPEPRPRPPSSPGTLDGSWDRRLRSGSVRPDRVLDLHGHSLDRAWMAIDQALEQAITEGARTLLLITGHLRAGDPPVQRGRIRAAVNDWLAASRHAPKIAAVREAHRRHGGGGSLYIVLRKG